MKILYILSDVRSGSTLLENIFSSANHIKSVGELCYLGSYLNKWSVGESTNWKCSCGKDFQDCEYWKNVLDLLKEKGHSKITDTKIIKTFNTFHTRVNITDFNKNKEIVKLLNDVYTTVFDLDECEIIVDSSKDESQLLALYKQIDFDIKVVYIKRDIRAVTSSKLKWSIKREKKKINKFKILILSKLKTFRQKSVLKHVDDKDKIFIKYEELARNPQETINQITQKFNLEKIKVPEYMEQRDEHAIAGTPNRSKKRKIQYDDSWVIESKKNFLFHIVGNFFDRI